METNNPTRKQQALAELKQRTKIIAILFCASILVVAIFFLFKEPPIDNSASREPDGVLNGHCYVDLGLSIKWAEANVGAEADTLVGDYFAWGEIDAKERYAEDNYTYIGHKQHSIERKRKHDAATNGFGRGWRMPTKDEVTELVEKCSWELEATEGRCGYRVTGPNGNSIFIPADNASEDAVPMVTLWSSYSVDGDSTSAYAIQVADTMRRVVATPAYRGLQVRAVTR